MRSFHLLDERRRRRLIIAIAALLLVGSGTTAAAQPPSSPVFAARRAALAKRVGNGVVIVSANPEPNDNRVGYLPDENIRYLTGITEPGTTLLISVRDSVAVSRLFVYDRNPAAEVWTGDRLGPARFQELTGMPTASGTTLVSALDGMLANGDTLRVANDTANTSPTGLVIAALRGAGRSFAVRNAARAINQLRAVKDQGEIDLIATAAKITTTGFSSAVGAIAPGRFEYEVEAAINASFRRQGADGNAFPTIVASGNNATTLHYETNDSALPPEGLVLMDIGASYHDYGADFTRTLPVSGHFSTLQRELYDVVLNAQLATDRAAVPGVNFRTLSDTGISRLATGLRKLGLIDSLAATYDPLPDDRCPKTASGACPQWFLYFMHSVGHGVGLDVHDPMQPTLPVGSVFMIEMAAYVRLHPEALMASTPRNKAFLERTAAAHKKFGGLGVRMEDEYVMESTGARWLTQWPREAAQVERAMARNAKMTSAAADQRYPRP